MRGIVGTRNTNTNIVSKMVGLADGAQRTFVAGRAIGGTVAETGKASVGSRACHKRFCECTVWNVPVIVFVSK